MSKRILIVDDAAFMRMMIKDILSKMDLKLLERQQMVYKLSKSTMN